MAEPSLRDAEAILGLTRPYSPGDVHRAYRQKSKQAHPDAGGTADEFVKLKAARDLVSREITRSARPREVKKERPAAGKDGNRDAAAWRMRQHRPWDTADRRAREYGRAGAQFVDPARGSEQEDDSPPVELGDHIRVLLVLCAGEALVGSDSWSGQIVQRGARVLISFQLSSPLDVLRHDQVTCIFTLSGDDEVLSLSGRVVERCHDRDGRLTMFCADLLGQIR